jgi:multidrug efflux pump subunit AcrB
LIKKFIAFGVDKAIVNHILFILMLIMAIFAYKEIPKELFPPAELDKIVINGAYSGASADMLDKMAVKPIEEDLKTVSGIYNIESSIRNGIFSITLDLKEESNPQDVLNDVKDVISNAKKDLPSDMNEPTAKVLVHHFPLLLIAISGDVGKEKLLEAAKALKSRLSKIKDLGTIDIRGDADYEIKIRLNTPKIEAYGLNKTLVYQAISNLSSIFPIGNIKFKDKTIYISSNNGEKDVNKLKNTILKIANKNIYLKDIADVSFGLSTSREISHFNGKENVSLNVTKQKHGNAIELSKEIRKILKEFEKEYKDITFEVYTDTSIWIRNRINLVTSNIFFGLILVFISIFLSVNWKISTVVALGIPTSFFIGLIFANEFGYSLNMLSMLGALLALGMLVDEAIVVAENIYRHLEMGKSPREAAIDGAAEVFPAVLTATATTIFAFLPLLIMSGKMGIFVKILPIMISILLLSSLFEAFYFLPLHAKELFSIGKIHKEEKSRFWEGLKSFYEKILLSLLRFKIVVVPLLIIAIIFASFSLFKSNSFELFPKFDAEQIYISGKVDNNHKLKETAKLVKPLEDRLLQDLNKSEVSSLTSIVGISFKPDNSFESGEHLFHIFINLKERKPQNFFDKYINPLLSLEYDDTHMQREHNAFEILKTVQASLEKILKEDNATFKDISAYVPQAGIVGNDIEIFVVDDKKKDVDYAINKIQEALKAIDGVEDVLNNKKLGPKEIKLKVNSYGQELGFNENNLASALRGMLLDAEYGKMLSHLGIVKIKLEDKNRENSLDIKTILLTTPNGLQKVALRDIANFIDIKAPLVLNKKDGKRLWEVTAQVDRDKIVPSEVMKKIEPVLKELKKQGYEFIIEGEQKANKQVIREMGQAAIIAIFLIFLSLVLMFNSAVQSLIVLSVIPLSIFGALLGTKLVGLHLTMMGAMGIVGLAGVVVNDAIIMIDFIKKAKNAKELAYFASTRLRPIMLTSVTTILGLFTLMFFASGQALIIQPMAVALGFGVAWATILNLIYIPLMYALIYRIKDEKTLHTTTTAKA